MSEVLFLANSIGKEEKSKADFIISIVKANNVKDQGFSTYLNNRFKGRKY